MTAIPVVSMPDGSDPYKATTKVKTLGRVAARQPLETVEDLFVQFELNHGSKTGADWAAVHDEWMTLLETLEYRGHLFMFDVKKRVWMVENLRGKDSWTEVDPHAYFTFAAWVSPEA